MPASVVINLVICGTRFSSRRLGDRLLLNCKVRGHIVIVIIVVVTGISDSITIGQVMESMSGIEVWSLFRITSIFYKFGIIRWSNVPDDEVAALVLWP